MRLTLAITTHARPDALAAVLASVAAQRVAPEEIIVADDGTGEPTRAVVRAAQRQSEARATPPFFRLVEQPHEGFRLTRLRNLAIAAARGDYLVFVDGDMLLHPEFIADHRAAARPGHFVQGVRIPLGADATRRMLAAPGRLPTWAELRGTGLRRAYALHSPLAQRSLAVVANGFVAIKGCNQGFWREHLVRVNGFDEAMQGWGPEDKELCARLRHAGVQRRTLVGGGIAWHLQHAPAARERREANETILRSTRASRRVRCVEGLDRHAVL